MQHAKIANGISGIALALKVAMQGVVGVPQSEVLIEAGAQRSFHFGGVPVGLPGVSILIPQGFNHDHLALKLPVLDRSSRGRCPLRSL